MTKTGKSLQLILVYYKEMIEKDNEVYREFRCNNDNCRALLACEYIYAGRLFIKCPECNKEHTIKFRSNPRELLDYLFKYHEKKTVRFLKYKEKEKLITGKEAKKRLASEVSKTDSKK